MPIYGFEEVISQPCIYALPRSAGRECEQGSAECAVCMHEFGSGEGSIRAEAHLYKFIKVGFVDIVYLEACESVVIMEVESPAVEQQFDIS